MTGWGLPAKHVIAMSFGDWVAYALCAIVVSLTMVGELKDIMLVRMQILQAGDKLSARWRFFLTVLNGVRRWVFLPGLLLTVVGLVVFTGGKASNICFSTVAILFVSTHNFRLSTIRIACVQRPRRIMSSESLPQCAGHRTRQLNVFRRPRREATPTGGVRR